MCGEWVVCGVGVGVVTLLLVQGKMAIHSPHTGIVDWARVTRAYAQDFSKAGGRIHTNYEVRPPTLTPTLTPTRYCLYRYVDLTRQRMTTLQSLLRVE